MYPVQFPSPVKDGRRILGEKPANACLSPARNRNVDAASSPVKRPLSGYSSSASPNKKLLPSPSFAGRKRTIDQVEDPPVNNGGFQVVWGEEYNSMQAAAERAMRKEMQQERQQQQQQHQQRSPIETQHDLPSPLNMSRNQNRGDNMTRSVPGDPETRKVFIQEKANLLRNRIQSAMRHVKDDQLDRRLSDLEAHSRKYPRLSNQPPPPQQNNQTPKQAVAPTSTTTHSTATSPLSETTPRTLQPAPDMNETTSNNADKPAPGLSSPPLSANNTTHDPMRTPTQTTHQHHSGTSPMQLSSPPATVMRSGCDTDIAGTEQHAGGIASEKGDAVDGLLKLMNTADKRESQDV